MPSIFLTAEWRDLLMVNYLVDPALLEPFVPVGTELDYWQGKTYLSVVGFRFLRTKVLGVPIPFHRNFDEVNLRFYVRRRSGNEWRTGVVFIKEIVPKWAVAFVARTVYNENYECYPMRSCTTAPGRVGYTWYRGRKWEGVTADVTGKPFIPSTDSEEYFISEHYWGYARQRNGSTLEYGVEHSPWQIRQCHSPAFDCDVCSLYDVRFTPFLTAVPASVFYADGSAVVVRRGVAI